VTFVEQRTRRSRKVDEGVVRTRVEVGSVAVRPRGLVEGRSRV